ncbi:MAG: hypothetical protein AAGC55_25890, partial [Myxococcota bacterium]
LDLGLPEAGEADRDDSRLSTEEDIRAMDSGVANRIDAADALTRRPFNEAKAAVVAEFERSYLSQLMAEHTSLHAAAQAAGMDRKHLRILLRRHDLRD